jgi:hypothetical protein
MSPVANHVIKTAARYVRNRSKRAVHGNVRTVEDSITATTNSAASSHKRSRISPPLASTVTGYKARAMSGRGLIAHSE